MKTQANSTPIMHLVPPHSTTPTHNLNSPFTPIILSKQSIYAQHRKAMLDNYRYYVQQYNELCDQMNISVCNYNANVHTYVAQHELQDQSKFEIANFKKEYSRITINEYNQEVEKANQDAGTLLILKKKFRKIPKAIEHTFTMILFKYAMQVDEKNRILESCNATTTRSLQKVTIHPHELANTVIGSINTLPYHKRTIQNHVNRLIEAGVLFDHEFYGTNKPSHYHINAKILVVFDSHFKNLITIENQPFKYGIEKDLHYNEIVTRTNKNKKKITEIVNNQFPLKDDIIKLSLRSNNQNINQNTKRLKTVPQDESKPERAEISEKNSLFLENMVESTPVLIQNATNGMYDNYRFTQRKRLEHEALHGTMDATEFRNLLLQIFVMMSAPIWKNTSPYLGSWYKAWQIMEDQFILNVNNSVPGKSLALYYFDNLVWRLTYSKRFFRTFTEYKPLFPGQYFDPTRKTKASGGFAYTLEALKKQQQYDDIRKKRKLKREQEAIPRNENYKAIELINKKVNALKNGKISITDLHDYVTTNAHIPQHIAAQLPKYVERAYKS